MTDAPLRICITIAGYEERAQYDPHWTMPTGAAEEIEYHLHTREALAQSPIVQAMIAEEREACAKAADDRADYLDDAVKWGGASKYIASVKGDTIECRNLAAAIRNRGVTMGRHAHIDGLEKLMEAVKYGPISSDTIATTLGDTVDDALILAAFDGDSKAAVDLMSVMLPGWGWSVGCYGFAGVYPPDAWGSRTVNGGMEVDLGTKPARALVWAILMAYRVALAEDRPFIALLVQPEILAAIKRRG